MGLLYSNQQSAAVIFPSIFYSRQGLAAILDIIGALHLESSNEYSSYPILYLPHSQESLHLPCSRIAIKEIASFLDAYINETLYKALCQSQKSVISAYAYYVFSSNKLLKSSSNQKISSITNFGISVLNHHYYASKIIPIAMSSLLESYLFPEKFHLWLKLQMPSSSYKLRDETVLQMQGNYLSIADSLLASKIQLKDLLLTLRKWGTEEVEADADASERVEVLGKITAMMIIAEQDVCFFEIVQVPLCSGSLALITASVFCWDWLICSIPSIRPSLFMALHLSWREFISQGLLVQRSSYGVTSSLISYNTLTGDGAATRLESMKLVTNFVQRQVYSSMDEPSAQGFLIKIVKETLERKLNPEALNCEAGLEIFLLVVSLALDIVEYSLEENSQGLVQKLLDFSISGFLVEHAWIKASSISKFQTIKELYEKCIESLKTVKIVEEEAEYFSEYYLDDPHSWKPREEMEVFMRNPRESSLETKYAEKKDILSVLIYHQYQRFLAWNSSVKFNSISPPKKSLKTSSLVKCAWKISPGLGQVFSSVVKSSECHPNPLSEIDEENKYLFTIPPHLPLLISRLDSKIPSERSYCLKLLQRSPEHTKLYFMQQILQCGGPQTNYQDYTRVLGEEDTWTYLTNNAVHSSVFLSQLIWMLEVSLFIPDQDLSPTLGHNFYRIILEIIQHSTKEWEQFTKEQKYFEKFLLISAELIPKNPENFNIINEKLTELSEEIPEGVYIPTNPQRQVVGLRHDNGRPLQSAKRTPILVTFYTRAHSMDKPRSTQCIFKVNDDVRNDQLCLQVIELMKEILVGTGLKIYLRPYKVISNITHTSAGDQLSGIIECIPNCKSRDEIGKEGTESLHTYFLEKFGNENSNEYAEAKKNFIASLAGYAVASYILQIKDRHNGNILIDEFGHILHIDFGFILSISPGGNLRFERPGFKLTQEMVDIIGKNDPESFEFFKSLVVKGYLAVREHAQSFITLVARMEHSGLTCFRKGAVTNFIKRFYLASTLPEAIKKINEKISKANNSFFTLWYDRIQLMQQQIEY